MSHTVAAAKHVAVIMDGNGRWAQARHLPRAEGHRRGVLALHRLTERAAERGVKALTVFAFSSENWRRPKAEVDMLMRLFATGLRKWEPKLIEAGIALRVIGDVNPFPEAVKSAIIDVEASTAVGGRMRLNVAANYGGRWDMLKAVERVLAAGEALTPEAVSANVSTADVGEVDLLIRTGGEQRISNFVLWQAAYAEIYFTPTLWPDYDGRDLDEALAWFEGRERRFGMTGEQIRSGRIWAKGGPPRRRVRGRSSF